MDGAGGVSTTSIGTDFSCTNTLQSTAIVDIEIFGPSGGPALNHASASSPSVSPGGSVRFSTSALTAFIVDGNLAVGVIGGSARVLTTASSKASQGILCTAILTERANDPPLVMATLPVIRKNTQQGD